MAHNLLTLLASLVAIFCLAFVDRGNPRAWAPLQRYLASRSMSMISYQQEFGRLRFGLLSNGSAIFLQGRSVREGLGTMAPSTITVALGKAGANKLRGRCSYPDTFVGARYRCIVRYGGKKILYQSEPLHAEHRFVEFSVPITALAQITLETISENAFNQNAPAVWDNLELL